MKKTFSNFQIENIASKLMTISVKSDVKTRWGLALKAEPFLVKNRLLTIEKNKIITEEGSENENGVFTLPLENERYQELFNCKTEIEFDGFDLDDLRNATMDELLTLKDVINHDS